MNSRLHSQVLLIDADDTLWENNIYFERVIAEVQVLVRDFGVDASSFRARLDATERRHVPVYGYGTVNFCRSLLETFEAFLPADADPLLKERVRRMGLAIMEHPLEFLDGVRETLEYLHTRHRLHLLTKGCPEEQTQKVAASKLGSLFHRIDIVSEKNEALYRELVRVHRWDPARCWMVGNSPRSDINPAIAAGIRAVFIPHPNTWVLEHEEPVVHPRVLRLNSFSELKLHF